MRFLKAALVPCVVLTVLLSPAAVLAIPCNTGVTGGAGTCLGPLLSATDPDAHWSVLAPFPTASSSDPIVGPTFVGTFSSAYANNLSGSWLATGPDSGWITPSQAPNNELGGQYVYRTSFVGNTPFSGRFADDNILWAAYLDGVLLGGYPGPGGPSEFNFWTNLATMYPTGGPLDSHTLDFVVRNAGLGGIDATPTGTGFRAEFVAEAVPEPSTVLLVAFGLTGLAWGRRKRA